VLDAVAGVRPKKNVRSVPFVRRGPGLNTSRSQRLTSRTRDTPPAVAGARPKQPASVDVYGPLDAGTRPPQGNSRESIVRIAKRPMATKVWVLLRREGSATPNLSSEWAQAGHDCCLYASAISR